MTKPRKTTKEPKLAPDHPWAPIVELLTVQVRMLSTNDDDEFVRGKREGLESAITLFVREAAKGEVTLNGQRLVKVERTKLARPLLPSLEERVEILEGAVNELQYERFARRETAEKIAKTFARRPPSPLLEPPAPRKPPAPAPKATKDSRGACKLLAAVAVLGERATMATITTVTGYRATSIRTYTGELTGAGRLRVHKGHYEATPDGKEWLRSMNVGLPCLGRALYDARMAESSEGERKLLTLLAEAWPGRRTLAALGERSGYRATSVRTYAGKLTQRKLAHASREGLRADDLFFEEGALLDD